MKGSRITFCKTKRSLRAHQSNNTPHRHGHRHAPPLFALRKHGMASPNLSPRATWRQPRGERSRAEPQAAGRGETACGGGNHGTKAPRKAESPGSPRVAESGGQALERGSSTAPLAENGRQGHPSVRPPPTSAPALPAPSPAHPQPWAPHFRLVGTALPATSAALPVPGKAPDASQRTPPSNSCGRRPPPPRFSPPTSGAREAWLYPGSQWKSAVGGGGGEGVRRW